MEARRAALAAYVCPGSRGTRTSLRADVQDIQGHPAVLPAAREASPPVVHREQAPRERPWRSWYASGGSRHGTCALGNPLPRPTAANARGAKQVGHNQLLFMRKDGKAHSYASLRALFVEMGVSRAVALRVRVCQLT